MPRQSSTKVHPSMIHQPLGAFRTGPSQVTFRAWAPWVKTIAVQIIGNSPETVPMTPQPFGYWEATVSNVGVGTRYYFLLHEKLQRPDPASRFQPEGVHGPSEVIEGRTSAADASLESSIARRARPGPTPAPEELLWMRRRRDAAIALERCGCRLHIVTTPGRKRV